MDRSSRFQNPMPPSSGGFGKPPPIQNDGVGTKPSLPLILDRFRAMVKEKEEELRVFGGGALPLSTDEIVRLYEIVLSELTTNSKPIITDLTIIAGEQSAHSEGIADAICARIIEVSVDQKLPSLYLLDSIVKNIGKDYKEYFSARLPEVFCEAYAQVHPSMHHSMRHLFGTWSAIFPSSVLQKIETQLQFSASVNGQSSKTSGQHGIHVNPKYFEAQHQFGHSTVDTFGTERVSPTGRASLTTSGLDAVKKSMPSISRIMKPSSPYRIESLSPDNSPKRITARDEETGEWRKRNWQGNPSQPPKTSGAYKYNTGGLDLRGPRALISAYGMDEREKNLKLDTNGAEQNVAIRTWQNTEEEEFDWEDMTPTLADRRQQSNDVYSSSLSSAAGNLTARNSFPINHATARLVKDYGGNLSKAQLSSVTNSPIIEDVANITNGHDKIAGVLPNIAGSNDMTSRVPSNFTRESMILPHQLSQSHFNAKEGLFLSETGTFFAGDQQKPPAIGNFSNPTSTFNPTYNNSPAPEIRSADQSALAQSWNPAKFQNSHIMPSLPALPPHMQIRGQYQIQSEQHLGPTRSMLQLTMPQVPTLRPGPSPVNLQNNAQPNMLMSRDPRQNLPHLPSSNAMVPPPLNHGYLPHPQGPPNMPFHVRGPNLQTLHRGPFPRPNQGLHIGQNAPTPPAGPGLSGLISSLVAKGLISLTKQDSVGVEFDPDALKVRHESTITALYADLPRQCTTCGLRFKSQDEHSKHMDWHVNKNRTLKNRKTKPSPKWFVNATMWLSGAEALGTETAPGFLPAENDVEKEDDEELAVPADEDQNVCALCGEPFDDFYSDETEEWMYRGAVYMNAPAGATVGMDRLELGPIVHAKCRSDTHGNLSEGFRKDDMELAEEGSQRKRLRSSLS
ncbi:polyadenylation and cleavage factor homolog 4 [Phtheirospermum japonicum]|uniref:Polyadenylation and cleavage factor homolog 4 n=1 Tax=Phtheirospermum japonicum TaxID=374723 RepID=A0A830D6M6_9LAMI|nr:polyadenylation and cleavage factor homolog 4 [Phtheirospermum japonicum]